MEIDLITFSPTHTGATVARQVAAGFSTATDHVAEHDMTLPDHETSITVTGTAIFVAPVYGGRVAETAVERFAAVHAAAPGQTPAILLVVYGNRDYEDALVELRDLAVRQGFAPLSAAAFIGEHSYSRPDEGRRPGRCAPFRCRFSRQTGRGQLGLPLHQRQRALQDQRSVDTGHPRDRSGSLYRLRCLHRRMPDRNRIAHSRRSRRQQCCGLHQMLRLSEILSGRSPPFRHPVHSQTFPKLQHPPRSGTVFLIQILHAVKSHETYRSG